jgi:NAD(P)-dependent dehydrogenase (short-subunit alcohol dehydrogenase family)
MKQDVRTHPAFLLFKNKKMESLKGKIALVTGAGKGIGKAIALALAAEGAHVGLIARTEKDLLAVAEEIKAAGVNAVYATADVSNRSEVESAVEKIKIELGAIDILINNAGTGTFGTGAGCMGAADKNKRVWCLLYHPCGTARYD